MKYEDLKIRQSWTLEQKIDHTVGTIEAFLAKTDGKGYISFSGGKDSTVLLDIARKFVRQGFPAVFCNTGNEFPEIVQFVRTFDDVSIIKPKMRIPDVLEKYGFPIINKEQSQYIREYKHALSEKNKDKRLNGKINKNGRVIGKISDKWKFLLNAPFEVSEQCCNKLKKEPFGMFEKETGLLPIIGTMVDESLVRFQKWLKQGCNSFDSKRIASYPLSIWKEADIWTYIRKFNIKYSPIYDKGCNRTGCMFCGFGCHLEKGMFNRFDMLNHIHPKAYQLFMNYTNSGITYREALEYTGIILPDSKNRQQTIFNYGDLY
ncbi:MAG: phosphoadenosine phosphosulfate reductase family protein [Dysgonamonadaceae bacterium]|jgi:3'-phosphoadenosine 5'-phosphosulfate sulfotransferase (PAPS reductase)/FAD synthetase|nr:phosphoadenosine phosphosulfate reductase family protein [Dysgonamonadaceae bacterium]